MLEAVIADALPAAREIAKARARPTLALLDWVRRYRSELEPERAFDLNSHRYLRAICQDQSPELVIMKSGQGGATEYCLSRAFWSCAERRMNTLYLLPTLGDISDFSQMRVGTAIEASPKLQALMGAGDTSRRAADRVGLKRIGARWLILRGSQVRVGEASIAGQRRAGASRLKSIPVDAVFYDEFDEMPPGAEALAGKRLGHSEGKKLDRIGPLNRDLQALEKQRDDYRAEGTTPPAELVIAIKDKALRVSDLQDEIVADAADLRKKLFSSTKRADVPMVSLAVFRELADTVDELVESVKKVTPTMEDWKRDRNRRRRLKTPILAAIVATTVIDRIMIFFELQEVLHVQGLAIFISATAAVLTMVLLLSLLLL